MLNLVLQNLKNTQYAVIANSAGPGLVKAFRGHELFWQVKMLSRSYFERRRFDELIAERQYELNAAQLPISVARVQGRKRAQENLSEYERRFRAGGVLAVFFHQLFSGNCTLLDLQYDSFFNDEERSKLVWYPSPLHIVWHGRFRHSLVGLYRGFFAGEQEVYEKSIHELNLWNARKILNSHLSSWLMPTSQFCTNELLEHFIEIFDICRAEKKLLHPNCLAWLVYLAILYEHLELLNEPVDVRKTLSEASGDPIRSVCV